MNRTETNKDLVGCTALVTGASRNIGRAIALELASRGADIAVHVAHDLDAGKETASLVEKLGQKSILVDGDLSRPEVVDRVIDQTSKTFAAIDIVVNNAAIRPEGDFATLSYEDWRKVLGVCLDSVFLVSQKALPFLNKSNHGTIVNIGGLTGHTGAKNRAHVITSKAGVAGLTKAMAHELAPDITVNCISPGLVETIREGGDPHHHKSRTNLAARHGSPEEIAAAVGFLCGKSARYITGQTLHVNGGAYLS